MKKVFVLLLIASLSLFALVGCEGLFPPSEGEGEGEGEPEGVIVEIEGAVELGGKTWISDGDHDVTITFPTPVENAFAWLSDCTGDYGKNETNDIVLFPNADKTVWTGSGYFGGYSVSYCCASYLYVEAGECEAGTCLAIPIIVDWLAPYVQLELTTEYCTCEGCQVTFQSTSQSQDCAEAEECCGDDCSGLAGWSIAIFEEDPFDQCCETPCEEPIFTCSGTACPIECTTDCLEPQGFCSGEVCLFNEDAPYWYYVIINLVDHVGNESAYYAKLFIERWEEEDECRIYAAHEFFADTEGYNDCDCTDWIWGSGVWMNTYVDNKVIIGSCTEYDICCPDDVCSLVR
jgi:hypothetical protein